MAYHEALRRGVELSFMFMALGGCLGPSDPAQSSGAAAGDGHGPDESRGGDPTADVPSLIPHSDDSRASAPSDEERLVFSISVEGPNLTAELDGYAGSPGTFTFSANATRGTLASVVWDLGGGRTATGTRVSHAFTQAGDYLIRGRATEESGQVAIAEVGLRIPLQATHWYMWGYRIPIDPVDLEVVILPPAYLSSQAMIGNASWVGPDALYRHPAVQAAIEAAEYWEWFLSVNSEDLPQLSGIGWTVKVSGYDAGVEETRTADILIDMAIISEPPLLKQYLGFAGWHKNPIDGHPFCLATHAGVNGGQISSHQLAHLRDFMLHEFGHCIGAGHSGEFTGPHCSTHYGCFDNHPTDVMSGGHFENRRNCLSNVNLFALAEAYDWRAPIQDPERYDGEAFVPKNGYHAICMPESMNRF